MELLHKELTDQILKSFFKVYNTLGYGFLEKVYENSLCHELRKNGFYVAKQHQIKVYYDELQVGEYFADLIVNDLVIVELKAAEAIIDEHEYQLLNYLKATDKEVGLLLNFGKRAEIRRKVFTNENKKLR